MSLSPNEKCAFTYLRNGFVRYEEDGVLSLGAYEVARWRLPARLLSKQLVRYVPETFACALFCEAVRSGRIRTKNGAWCGRLTDKSVIRAIREYLADRGPRYISRYFKDVPREEPVHVVLTTREMDIWRQGYKEGLRRSRRRVA